MATYELRALSTGEILDEGFGLYREHFGTLLAIAVIWTGLPMLLSIYVEMGGGFAVHPLAAGIAALLRGIGGLFATAGTVWVIS